MQRTIRKTIISLLGIMMAVQLMHLPAFYFDIGNLYATGNSQQKSNHTPLTFELYDKVYASDGGRVSTVIDTRNNQTKMLSENGEETALTYDEAKVLVKNKNNGGDQSSLINNSAYKRLLNRYSEFYSMPLDTDLELVSEGDTLSSRITAIDSDWLFGNNPVDETIRYVTADNSLTGPGQDLMDSSSSSTDGMFGNEKCGTQVLKTTPSGTGAYKTFQYPEKSYPKYTKRTVTINKYSFGTTGMGFWGNVRMHAANATGTCTGSYTKLGAIVNGSMQITYVPGAVFEKQWALSGENTNYAQIVFEYKRVKDKPWYFNLKEGDVEKVYIPKSWRNCVSTLAQAGGKWIPAYLPPGPAEADAWMQFTVSKIVDTKTDMICPSPENKAKTGKVRLLNSLTTSDILFKNIMKKDLSVVSGHLDGAFPTSDDFTNVDTPAYLVVKDTDNTLELKSGKDIDSVTNTITTPYPSDHLVKIPLKYKNNSSEETNVITASAMINGEKKYGVLKVVQDEADYDSVYVDLRDFADDPTTLNKVDLSLYYESTGISDLTFMSDPLNVMIQLGEALPVQTIEYDADQKTSAAYGDEITLTSRLTSELVMQSDAEIKYTIVSGNAEITDQSYDLTTGIATAKIKPTNGVGDVTVSINKEGNDNVSAAKEQTHTFRLAKKNITIKADSYERDIGEAEPVYTIAAGEGDLISGDTIPPGIKAVTSYTATNGKLETLTSGTDITIEEDTSDEVQKFKEKYDITYVKGVLIVNVGENWLDISPPQNSDGWNHTDVTVKPAADALSAGYTKISLNGGDPAEGITIDSDRKKEDLKFILHKENGDTTNEISPKKDIRVDKTAPELTITTEKISTTFLSRILRTLSGQDIFYKDGILVTITATDDGSGVKDITSPSGSGTISENGNTKTMTFTVTEDFKGTITADAENNAGLSATETSERIINENGTGKIKIQTTSISGHVNANDVFEARLNFDVTASQSGLKEVRYSIDGGEEKTLKSYMAADADDANLTLTDPLELSLTDIIQNAAVDSDTLKITVSVLTNSGNILSKEISVHYDIKASEISLITVTNENIWASSKKVDFSVNEEGSGIKSVTVTKPDGSPVDRTGELTQNNFNFTAYEAGTYTILVIDNADNESMKVSKTITKIDPDVPVIKDVVMSPENTEWSKKKTITFHVTDTVDPDSGSGVDIDSFKVIAGNGNEPVITCTGNKDDMSCTFEAVRKTIIRSRQRMAQGTRLSRKQSK